MKLTRRLFGLTAIILIGLQTIREIYPEAPVQGGIVVCLLIMAPLMSLSARSTGRVLLVLALGLTLGLIWRDADWQTTVWKALTGASFFIAFFCALTSLRNAAATSPSMIAAGNYLARQPPGRRYLALTVGAQAFSFVLNYGAIQLLGTLAMTSAKAEPDARIRAIRTRRMLLAVQRGFISSVPWSPLSFSIAIVVAVVPGTSWLQVAGPGAVASLLMVGAGWALDTIFKPRPSGGAAPAQQPTPGGVRLLLPLGFLLVLMMALIATLEVLLGIRVVGVVLMIVPALSLGWIVLQAHGLAGVGARLRGFVDDELPALRGEVLLIGTAGYIGAAGAVFVKPYMAQSGMDLTLLPNWAMLVGLVIILPALGQVGANPILSLSLIGPLLPDPAAVGIAPAAIGLALVSGWAITGLTSPFTATNLLIGRFGGISAWDVGWVWNRSYSLIVLVMLCGWTILFASLSGW